MAKEKRRMCAAESIAGTDHTILVADRDWFQCNVRMENRQHSSDCARRLACANRHARQGKFDEPATSERVTKTAFPSDERCRRKRFGECGALQFSCFKGTRPV